jgi:hypothetical protein
MPELAFNLSGTPFAPAATTGRHRRRGRRTAETVCCSTMTWRITPRDADNTGLRPPASPAPTVVVDACAVRRNAPRVVTYAAV